MIKYALICDKEHEFEAWFASSDDYEMQRKRGFLDCPSCGSSKIEKMLMAPGVSGTKKTGGGQVSVTSMPEMPAQMVEQLREIKKYVEANSENVGERFPEEARKIHYGEAEARGIYGKANLEEAASLAEEGVNVMPIPELPEDKN
ncbi:MAG: DUF1178 family protein [Pseudomonadota bacterium]